MIHNEAIASFAIQALKASYTSGVGATFLHNEAEVDRQPLKRSGGCPCGVRRVARGAMKLLFSADGAGVQLITVRQLWEATDASMEGRNATCIEMTESLMPKYLELVPCEGMDLRDT